MKAVIREIVARHGRLAVPAEQIADDADLFVAGLDSLAITSILLAVEDRFEIEFTEAYLVRASFASVDALCQVVANLKVAETTE
jgi:acyl carrier protein